MAEGAEGGSVPFTPSARGALERTGRWANRAGVFMAGGALTNLLSGAMLFWSLKRSIASLQAIHATPGSRYAVAVANSVKGLKISQAFILGAVILGAVVAGLMGWLALRFGLRLMRIRHGGNGEAFTAAVQAQRGFWRTQGILLICALAFPFAAAVIIAILAASHVLL